MGIIGNLACTALAPNNRVSTENPTATSSSTYKTTTSPFGFAGHIIPEIDTPYNSELSYYSGAVRITVVLINGRSVPSESCNSPLPFTASKAYRTKAS
jgi:hypothetical protein